MSVWTGRVSEGDHEWVGVRVVGVVSVDGIRDSQHTHTYTHPRTPTLTHTLYARTLVTSSRSDACIIFDAIPPDCYVCVCVC